MLRQLPPKKEQIVAVELSASQKLVSWRVTLLQIHSFKSACELPAGQSLACALLVFQFMYRLAISIL